jgi:hypothetical protein
MARVKLQLPANFPFHTEIPIRISDINNGGHLGNDAVLSIVHEARIQFLRSLGYSELDIEETGIMMTDAIIVYSSEGFYGDVLQVDVGTTDFQITHCDFVFVLLIQLHIKKFPASRPASHSSTSRLGRFLQCRTHSARSVNKQPLHLQNILLLGSAVCLDKQKTLYFFYLFIH